MIHNKDNGYKNSYSKLINELKYRGVKNTIVLSLLQHDWPSSEKILRNLANHLSSGFIDENGRVVLVEIVTKALKAYECTIHSDKRIRASDHERMCVFLEALISATCHYMQIKAVDNRTAEVWTISNKEAFTQWVKQRSNHIEIVENPFDDERFIRAKLYEKVVTKSVKDLFREYKYEDSIVDGNLVTCS